jgi:hypothetical protein
MSGYIGYLPSYVRYHDGLSLREKMLYCELTAWADENSLVRLDRNRLGDFIGVKNVTKYIENLEKYKLVERFGPDHIMLNKDVAEIVQFSTMKESSDITDGASKIANKIIKFWNNRFNSNYKVTDKLTSTIRGRLKSFDENDIMTALENRCKFVEANEWHSLPENEHHKSNIYLVLRNDSEVEKYIHRVPKPTKIDLSRTTEPAKKIVYNQNILK